MSVAAKSLAVGVPQNKKSPKQKLNWEEIVRIVLTSRAMDDIEEQELFPQKIVAYQFSARGHDVCQAILGNLLNNPRDGVSAYYRSRPLLLSLGLTIEEGFAGPMGKSGGYSDGRDIGVVCNLPSQGKASVIPMSGDVGAQYTGAAGWAEGIRYHHEVLGDESYKDAIAVVLGGEGSVATNGFWSSLTIATTVGLPLLFFIEDNGFAISVSGEKQTPGGNIAENLESFKNLRIFQASGSLPGEAQSVIAEAVAFVRESRMPALIRLTVPRLSGHSGQDTQAYKSKELIKKEREQDPLPALKSYLTPKVIPTSKWDEIQKQAQQDVQVALKAALNRPVGSLTGIYRYAFSETNPDGSVDIQKMGGLLAAGITLPAGSEVPKPDAVRINLVEAVRKVIDTELAINPRLVVFGEDVGPKGGVHAATLGLQDKYGERRVYDTSLSEEGIIGRAVGMALNGLMPCAEIQFRKYADAATEQLHNCGTIRWRTNNRFAAPIVVRVPGGFYKWCGDPWHSVTDEVHFVHQPGWQVAFPSNAEDAVGLLRSALRSNNPTFFLEHRNLLDAAWARRPYPGDDFIVPFGKAKTLSNGTGLTVVTWGAMVERSEEAAKDFHGLVELIDLRSIMPWDKETVLQSVAKTHRCLIVHEDYRTAGFGAEIAAVLASESFYLLDAPISRLAVKDIPIPYNRELMEGVVPSVNEIRAEIESLLGH